MNVGFVMNFVWLVSVLVMSRVKMDCKFFLYLVGMFLLFSRVSVRYLVVFNFLINEK